VFYARYGKRTDVDAYRLQSRGGKGVINMKTSSKIGKVCDRRKSNKGNDCKGQARRIPWLCAAANPEKPFRVYSGCNG
jgi:DNA gyrase/topoisomerase IV subunit A